MQLAPMVEMEACTTDELSPSTSKTNACLSGPVVRNLKHSSQRGIHYAALDRQIS